MIFSSALCLNATFIAQGLTAKGLISTLHRWEERKLSAEHLIHKETHFPQGAFLLPPNPFFHSSEPEKGDRMSQFNELRS